MGEDKFNTVTWTLDSCKTMPRFSTAEEASGYTRIPAKRLLEMAYAGLAPCIRIDGGDPLFWRHDIVAWVRRELLKVQEGKPIPIHLHVHTEEAVDFETTPKAIAHLDGLREWKSAAPGAVVYFLVCDGMVVYVGQSMSLIARLQQHRPNKLFDHVFYLPVPSSQLNDMERKFIHLLKPPLNKAFPIIEEITAKS